MISLLVVAVLLLGAGLLFVLGRAERGAQVLVGTTGIYGVMVISAHAQAAAAAAGNVLSIPWGTLLGQFLIALTPAIVALAGLAYGWAKSRLPAAIVTSLNGAHADKLIDRALYKAIAMVEGAAKGKVVEVPVANALILQASEFLIQEAPWLAAQLGNRLGAVFAGKLAEQGMLPDNASAKNLVVKPASNPPQAAK